MFDTGTNPNFIEAAKSILEHGLSLNARNLADALQTIYDAGMARANAITVAFTSPVDLSAD